MTKQSTQEERVTDLGGKVIKGDPKKQGSAEAVVTPSLPKRRKRG